MSASSNVNRCLATRSLPTCVDALSMFTCRSPSTCATSRSSLVRSRASTWIITVNVVAPPAFHDTSMKRSGSRPSDFTLGQSLRCTETP